MDFNWWDNDFAYGKRSRRGKHHNSRFSRNWLTQKSNGQLVLRKYPAKNKYFESYINDWEDPPECNKTIDQYKYTLEHKVHCCIPPLEVLPPKDYSIFNSYIGLI